MTDPTPEARAGAILLSETEDHGNMSERRKFIIREIQAAEDAALERAAAVPRAAAEKLHKIEHRLADLFVPTLERCADEILKLKSGAKP